MNFCRGLTNLFIGQTSDEEIYEVQTTTNMYY